MPLDRTIFAARRAKLDADYAAALAKTRAIPFHATVGDLAPEVDRMRAHEASLRPQPELGWLLRTSAWLVAHKSYHGLRLAVRDLILPKKRPRSSSGSNGV